MNESKNTPTKRRLGVLLAAAAAVLMLTACLPEESMTSLSLLNRDRAAAGRSSLTFDETATVKAHLWAANLAKTGRLTHSNLASGMEGTGWCSIGENVGYASSPEAVQDTFMRSSGHRANLLNPQWTHVGIGSAKADGRVYVVQVFFRKGC